MTADELQFYYFKQHDYDNNNKLDGIELIQGYFLRTFFTIKDNVRLSNRRGLINYFGHHDQIKACLSDSFLIQKK